MIVLTEEQGQQLDGPTPLAIDPRTKKTYVLVPEAVYHRIQSMVDDEEDILATGEMVDRVMADADAGDPTLESYQHYRKEAGKRIPWTRPNS